MTTAFMAILASVLAITAGVMAVVYLVVPIFKAIGWVIAHLFRFVRGMVGDGARLIGAVLATVVLAAVCVGNIAIGRWSAAAHCGRAVRAECFVAGRSLYRLVIGHPARLLLLAPMVEGLEQRLPGVIAGTPGADRPRGRAGQFEGYRIVGSLPRGGSGGQLYVAEPTPAKLAKLAALARSGQGPVERVVIKCFSLRDGSSLPQIVRESRALDAAKRLGLILEHELSPERFCYVMRYVPGDSLNLVTQRLHALGGEEGLDAAGLGQALGFGADLMRTLCHYHAGGLWHKDVKPDNIIIADGQAHLVDFGLVSHLGSAMTLTTHGTEYFRDPEMVRLALRGVKVHEVDGARFDIYAAGAVLYSMIENSFPAHGGLSRISRRCPEALRWIVRRAMTDYDKRYASAAEMLADLEAVAEARDPFAVRVAELPSVGGAEVAPEAGDEAELVGAGAVAARGLGSQQGPGRAPLGAAFGAAGGVPAAAVGAAMGAIAESVGAVVGGAPRGHAGLGGTGANGRGRPAIQVNNWWTGRYSVNGAARATGAGRGGAGRGEAGGFEGAEFAAFRAGGPGPAGFASESWVRHGAGGTAAEQLSRARRRANEARRRAHQRMSRHGAGFPGGMNAGVGVALLLFCAACAALIALTFRMGSSDGARESSAVRVAVDYPHQAGLRPAGAREAERRRGGPRGENRDGAVPVAVAESDEGGDESAGATSAEGDPEHLAKVLVIRDPSMLAPDKAKIVGERLAALEKAGFELLGVRGQEHVALVADLLASLSLTPFHTDEAGEVIRAWLADHPDIPMVLWIGKDKDDEALPWVVMAAGARWELGEAAAEALGER